MLEWWNGGRPNAQFDKLAYNRYNVDQRAHSDLVRWDVFSCCPFTFKFRYVVDNSGGRYCNIVDFCKGLNIDHNLLQGCEFDRQHVRTLNELVFCASRDEIDSLGSLFANNRGLIELLMRLPFVNKENVLTAIKNNRDDMRDKIEAVLHQIKTLNSNNDKFISAHKSFKLEVGARFDQFEQRLDALDTKFNALHAPSQATPDVVFPRDVTKHPHLAVFMSRTEETGNTQIAFVRGQMDHFRKRKLEFEDDMDVMFEGVHPNPLMAVQCIKEEFNNSGHKIYRLSKKVIEVKCEVNVAKDIVKKAIVNKI